MPALDPDAALIHIQPHIGVKAAQLGLSLRQILPDLAIVLISDHRIVSALSFLPKTESHGWSFVLKETTDNLAELKRTIEASVKGLVVLDPEMVLSADELPRSGIARLTPKQLQTLQLIAEGLTNRAIAEKLDVSVKAVENHINQIYQELEIDRSDPTIHPRIRATSIYFMQHMLHSGLNR